MARSRFPPSRCRSDRVPAGMIMPSLTRSPVGGRTVLSVRWFVWEYIVAEGLSLITFRTLVRVLPLTCRRENVVVSSLVCMGICPSCLVEPVAGPIGSNLIGHDSLTNFESTSLIGCALPRTYGLVMLGFRCSPRGKQVLVAAVSPPARSLCYPISQLI